MKKSFLLLGTAALGSMMLLACSDETTTSSSSESANACSLSSTEKGLSIKCGSEEIGYIKTTSDGIYGASCMAEALRDDSGYKLVCGGDSVGVVYNGAHGINGVNGTNGNPGKNGEPGTSCDAKPVTGGYELICGGAKVGVIASGTKGEAGANGTSCTVSKVSGVATISCEDGTKATVSDGGQGLRGLQGESCETDGLKYTDDDDGRTYAVISCGTNDILVYDGVKGESGAGCEVSKVKGDDFATITCGESDPVTINDGATGAGCVAEQDEDTGDITITCGDETPYTIAAPADGKNGDNCSIGANLDEDDNPIPGTAKITCGTGTNATTYIVKDGTAGKNGDNCSIGANLDEDDNPIPGTAKITCGTGTNATTYIVKDGTQGDAGYSCSAASYDGYSKITCGSADGDVETIVLAAGYAYCGEEIIDSIYNTLTHACVGSTVKQRIALSNLCGGAELADGHLCYNNVQKDTNDYAICGTSLYEKADQFCSAYNTIVNKCDGKVFDPATQYCEKTGTEAPFTYTVTNIYSVCGTSLYDTRTHYCSSTNVVTELSACTVDENTILYNPETHICDDSGAEPVVTPKE